MKKLFTLLMVVLSVLLWNCSGNEDKDIDNPDKGGNEKPENVTLDLSVTDLTFEATGGTKEFIVRSNTDWTITNTSAWCQISTDKGRTDEAVTVSVSAYTGMEDRNTNLTVKSGNVTKILSVTQKRKNAIVLSKDKFDVPQAGGNIDIEVKSNIQYEVTIPEEYKDWIKEAVKSKAVETKNFSFTISANEDYSKRDGFIVFEGNAVKDTVRIYQAQIDKLILTKAQCNISSSEQNVEVELRTNVDFEVTIPDSVSGWINLIQTRAIRTDKVNLSIGKNEGYDSRNAVVIFKDKNSELSDTLRIKQAQKNAIFLGQKKYDLPQVGGNIVVEVQSNIQYQVTIPTKFQSWLKQSIKSKALETKNYSFIISANEEVEPREGYIIFEGNSIKDTIKIYQEADTRKLILSNLSYLIPAKGKKVEIQLRTNVDFEVVIPDSVSGWISNLQTRAMRTEYVNLVITPNELSKKRNAVVIFKDKGSNLCDTVSIHQAANYILVFNQKRFDVPQVGGNIKVEIQSNFEYSVHIPDSVSGWVSIIQTKAIKGDNLNLKIEVNPHIYSRQALVIFKDENSIFADTVAIKQAQKDTIIFNHREINIPEKGDIVEIQAQSNINYQYLIPTEFQNWIKFYTQSGDIKNKIFKFIITDNKEFEDRKGYVLFKGESIIDTIKIHQDKASKKLYFTNDHYNISADGGALQVGLVGNVDYEITILPQKASWWIHRQKSDKESITFQVDFNRGNIRQAEIIIKAIDADLSDTLYVNQIKNEHTYVGNIEFKTSADITNFINSSYTGIVGNAVISENADVSYFNNKLEFIEGNLTVSFSSSCTSGLDGITEITGDLILKTIRVAYPGPAYLLFHMAKLQEIGGSFYSYDYGPGVGVSCYFSSLRTVWGDFEFHNLVTMSGFYELWYIYGAFKLIDCSLKSLNGIEELESIGTYLTIQRCSKLTDISALVDVEVPTIGILDCTQLYDFTPLYGVHCQGNFNIRGNGYNPTKEQIWNGQGKPQ